MTFFSEKKIFFLSGNLKNGNGIIDGFFPSCYNEPETTKSEWQINVSFVSFINKTALDLNDMVFISTNLVRDQKINNLGETEIWNPFILHLQFSGKSNAISLTQNHFTMSSFSSSVKFFFTEMSNNKPYASDVDVKMTIILQRKMF